ncbi:hypothetical protein [Geobacter sp. FeAm09]|uniref:hypothetical protein n=1 Tax=Geobacter sp. FeAm09 TaxID=2597769 RepID=UPI001F0FC422|nr:hypothetical protein [Geobacter sp. FeAm09]
MEPLDRETAAKLFNHYRKQRDGIRNSPEMASVCLICGSIHISPHPGDGRMLVCRNCGFAFYRYPCPACGATIDGRDPRNPGCRECGERICTCGACDCPTNAPPLRKKAADPPPFSPLVPADRRTSPRARLQAIKR